MKAIWYNLGNGDISSLQIMWQPYGMKIIWNIPFLKIFGPNNGSGTKFSNLGSTFGPIISRRPPPNLTKTPTSDVHQVNIVKQWEFQWAFHLLQEYGPDNIGFMGNISKKSQVHCTYCMTQKTPNSGGWCMFHILYLKNVCRFDLRTSNKCGTHQKGLFQAYFC